MLRFALRFLKYGTIKERIGKDNVPLYGDRLWPWLRCFIAIWLGLFIYWGFSLWFGALGANVLSASYSYGLARFWVFYIPVFGFFLQKFYYEYTSDGVWTPGTSYALYIRSVARDFFS